MANQPGLHPPNFRKGQKLPTAEEMTRLSRGTVQQIVGGKGIKVNSFNGKIVIEAVEVPSPRGPEIRHFEVVTAASDYLECNWVDGDGNDLNPAAYYYLAKPEKDRGGGGDYEAGDIVLGARGVGDTGVEALGVPCHWECLTSMAEGGGGAEEWTEIAASKYTATPASTSQINMSNTSDIKVGLPIRYTLQVDSDTTLLCYGIVDSFTANNHIHIKGAPLSYDIAKLEWGMVTHVVQTEFFVPKWFGDQVNSDLLSSRALCPFIWRLPKAYVVAFSMVQAVADGGTQPKMNVYVASQKVSTKDSNNGIQMSGTSWVNNDVVAINTSYYDVNPGETMTVGCTVVGGVGDASDLTVSVTLILE